jgi:hypothetical protein
MAEKRPQRRVGGWIALVLAVVVIGWVAQRGDHGTGTGTARATGAGAATTHPATASPVPTGPAVDSGDPNDPTRFAPVVLVYARKAAIDPQVLMAILYNESYKPHDPAFQRSWQKLKPDAAFGIANMHKAAFDDTRTGRDFAGRDWQELPDDTTLAVDAAAWYLHDLAAQLPDHWSGPYTKDELIALGYNTGAGNMRAFARGVKPGPQAQSYLDTLHSNWAKAGQAVKAVG